MASHSRQHGALMLFSFCLWIEEEMKRGLIDVRSAEQENQKISCRRDPFHRQAHSGIIKVQLVIFI